MINSPRPSVIAAYIKDIQQVAQFLSIANIAIPLILKAALKSHRPIPNGVQEAIYRSFKQKGILCTPEKIVEAWPVDLYFADKVLVELDEIQRHYGADGELRLTDRERDKVLRDKGYKILRLKNYFDKPIIQLVNSIEIFIASKEEYQIKDCDYGSISISFAPLKTKLSPSLPKQMSDIAPGPLSSSLFSNGTSPSTTTHNSPTMEQPLELCSGSLLEDKSKLRQ